ncbi:MAG: YifB family Mg chelatase-like AAA ATPase [Oscillospiraceae bacterium]|nr:YifB family Mg chelatase-like AAA ATPase [Oscillospiraceae bacterium]
MFAKANACNVLGMDGVMVEVEADLSNGMPGFDIVGLPDSAIKESRERVKNAIKNTGLKVPIKKLTINLAPASLKKEGAAFDLPIAMAVLATENSELGRKIGEYLLLGELALDGKLRPVSGVLPMVIAAVKAGITKVIIPMENGAEAAVVEGAEVYPAEHLLHVFQHFIGEKELERCQVDILDIMKTDELYDVDFSEVKGQFDVRRAVEIAVSGGHNVLMIGTPGSGKSMIAKRIPTILPDMTYDEALEVTKVHSVAGYIRGNTSLLTTRPFRSPHHTISTTGLAGGGSYPRPGELSLAHNGVLFLDELPEFNPSAIEVLRQPLEDGEVTISRVSGTAKYPCNILLVGSMNPCKCGYYGDNERQCNCTPPAVVKYRSRISGPLLDRIDIHINVPPVKFCDLRKGEKGESSAEIKQRVNNARQIQLDRYKDDKIYSNSQLTPKLTRKYCKIDDESEMLLKMAFDKLGFSARTHDRLLKVARTVADLAGRENIEKSDIAEAIQYRSFDRRL